MTRAALLKAGLFVLIVAGIVCGLHAVGVDVWQVTPERVRSYVLSFGALAPVIYLVVYGQPIIPLPASVMSLSAGLIFGPFWGSCGAVAGATTRACSEFFIARLLGRDVVAHLLKGPVASFEKKISENGFKAVLLIRLIPNVPFDMQNYGLGFSRVKFVPYVLATFLGILPGSFALVYLGYSLTDLRQLWKVGVGILLLIIVMMIQRRITARSKASA